MAFSNPSQVTRLYPPTTLPGIAEGDWVDVASVYTSGMRQRVMARAMQVRMPIGGGATQDVSIDAFAMRQALLEEVVRAWSDAAPVSPETLAGLPVAVADWISEEFDRLAGERPDETKKNSAPDSLAELSPASSVTSSKSNGSGSTA